MKALLIVLLAAAGLAAGPLLRAVNVRLSVPSGEPWRRACLGCDTKLSWYSPRLAAGRCASGRDRLGPPAATVEVATGALLGLLAAAVHPGLVLAAVALLAVCAMPLAFVDLASRRLAD